MIQRIKLKFLDRQSKMYLTTIFRRITYEYSKCFKFYTKPENNDSFDGRIIIQIIKYLVFVFGYFLVLIEKEKIINSFSISSITIWTPKKLEGHLVKPKQMEFLVYLQGQILCEFFK
ncbi:unnamed protein product [Paramecium primaurelia]|uniref:Uncharacterized protein n=1 Tax=Paramecium primaurelia TaxID=5886 RepID=A0A8S1PPM6_PARPR|nr:unnamed protein product [Paramecium primaurelia]